MIVRDVRGWEKRTLRRPREPLCGPNRLLDFDEHREMAHLFRTGQATVGELAVRFGVHRRTISRYLNTYPEAGTIGDAARRVAIEAERMGLLLTRDDAIRLAGAALTPPAEGVA